MLRDGEAAREHWVRWMDDERAHFAAHGTQEAADVCVDHAGGLVG